MIASWFTPEQDWKEEILPPIIAIAEWGPWSMLADLTNQLTLMLGGSLVTTDDWTNYFNQNQVQVHPNTEYFFAEIGIQQLTRDGGMLMNFGTKKEKHLPMLPRDCFPAPTGYTKNPISDRLGNETLRPIIVSLSVLWVLFYWIQRLRVRSTV
jgi:hypothetical protein